MAAALAPAADATISPFRSPVRSGRIVGVRFTKYASHKRLVEMTMYGPPLDMAVHQICDELRRHPGTLHLSITEAGELAISCLMLGPIAADGGSRPADLEPGTRQVVALVTGISKAEFEVGLSEIQRWNWVANG